MAAASSCAARSATSARPPSARKAGLVPVYQEPSLIPDLDVLSNLRLTQTPVEPFREWVRELGVPDLDLRDIARDVPLAIQRVLDLARALAVEPDVLLLDEMTAALPANLAERVLDVVRRQGQAGRSVIFISHRFIEISAVCNRATVLRDGETVGVVDVVAGVEERIVELMLGAKVEKQRMAQRRANEAAAPTAGSTRIAVRNLKVGTKLQDVSFDLKDGEVAGVVALEGQGQDELFAALAGSIKPNSGTIEVDGKAVKFSHPVDAVQQGIAYVPGDRSEALAMQQSVRENIALPFRAAFRNWGPINMRQGARHGAERHRAAADRHAGAARGAAPFRRQPAEGDDRPLDRGGRAHHPLLRPDARHRRAHQAGNLQAAARSLPTRGNRSCSTPPNSRKSSSSATAPSSSSAAASSTSCRSRSPTSRR